MDDQIELIQRVMAVQARYAEVLLQKKHVIGVAVGIKKTGGQPTGQVCLVVLVDAKIVVDALDDEDRIPAEIEGICVDVQVTGFLQAQ